MALWRTQQPLILASKSAVRRTGLENAGIPLECVPADIDERGLEERAQVRTPETIAELLAREKARVVSARQPGRIVLGADQTLALGNRIFSKPSNRGAARTQLMALRGQTHELHSAISLQRDGSVLFAHRAVARLTMRAFSPGFLEAYLQTAGDAVLATVGCYQVEGLGIQLF